MATVTKGQRLGMVMRSFLVVLATTAIQAMGDSPVADQRNLKLESMPCALAVESGQLQVAKRQAADRVGRPFMSVDGVVAYLYDYDKEIKVNVHYLGLALRCDRSLRNTGVEDMVLSCDGAQIPAANTHILRGYFGDQGLHVAIVFDRSNYLKDALPRLKTIAREILSQLAKEDWITVVATGVQVTPKAVEDWRSIEGISDMADLYDRIVNKIGPVTFSDLSQVTACRTRDALANVIQRPIDKKEKGKGPIERKILVVLSDLSTEDDSTISVDSLAKLAVENNVTIVVVPPKDITFNQQAATVLAQATGGAIWDPVLGRQDYRQRLETLSAPHLAVRMTMPTSQLPADGKKHVLQIEVRKGDMRSNPLALPFETDIGNVKAFWTRILEIAIPVFLVLLLVSVVIVVAMQRRRTSGRVPVSASSAVSSGEPPSVSNGISAGTAEAAASVTVSAPVTNGDS